MEGAPDIVALNEEIKNESAFIDLIQSELRKVIVGQNGMVEGLLIGLLANGHILLEGVPGLAKTLAINSLSKTLGGSFSRVQFTPDLLPSDVIGTQIYNMKDHAFETKQGPIFSNFVLADEINRAPAKVQSALLEAMHTLFEPTCRELISTTGSSDEAQHSPGARDRRQGERRPTRGERDELHRDFTGL